MTRETKNRYLVRELRRIVRRLIHHYKPERIVLFGSMASGETNRWSDIDLAIIKKTRRRFIHRLGDALIKADPREAMDVVVYTPKEVQRMEEERNPFWVHEIKIKGKTLYQRA